MKNFLSKFLMPFLFFAFVLSQMVFSAESALGVNPYLAFVVMTALAFVGSVFIPRSSHVKMGVEVEVWAQYIIDRLWRNNHFLQHAFSDDDKVLAGKIVHIPQPGSMPEVVKNLNVFPATAIRRTDSDITYTLDQYFAMPTHIQDAEKIELSYDKIDSIYGDHAGKLAQDVAGDAIIKWLDAIPQSHILRTTGGSTAATLPGATGNRKLFTEKDLRKAQLALNLQDVLQEERYALLPSNMLDQLKESLSQTQYADFSKYYDAQNGIIGKLHGFNILERSSVASAEADDTSQIIKPYETAGEPGDNDVAMLWQKNAVARALGEVKFFEKTDDPQYYGDVYSSLVRFGGRRRRADSNGIIALIQDTIV